MTEGISIGQIKMLGDEERKFADRARIVALAMRTMSLRREFLLVVYTTVALFY